MAVLYGLEFQHQSSAASKPHILSYLTSRSVADDSMFEVWNGATDSDRVFKMTWEGQLQVEDGTAAKPSYGFKSDKDSGRYMSAAGTFLDVIAGTAVGTWTAGKLTLVQLQVDNLNINGNTLSSTAGTDLLITPLSGQQIVLDSTIVIDAGVVTGATSITSDAFVGPITGTASVATVANTVVVVDGTDTSSSIAMFDSATGSLAIKTDAGLTYNAGTGMLTATGFTGPLTGLAATATALETARTIGGTSFDGTANIAVALATLATTVTITDNESTNEDNAIIFTAGGDVDGGSLGLESDGTLTYNPSTGKITATGFIGALTGNVTGTADVATVATTVTITDNESTNESNALIFTAGGDVDGGNLGLESDGTLTYNPSTGKVTATGFIGTLAGAVTGDVTGKADTADTLETARTIGGTSFDGSANIAVALAAEATALETARTIGGTSFDGTANIAVALSTLATTVTVSDNESTNESNLIAFVAGAATSTGAQNLEMDGTLTYNPSTGKITATGFIGAVTGNVTGTADVATVANTVVVIDSTDTTSFIAMFDAATGSLAAKTDAGLTYNAGTGMLTATGLTGPLTGLAATATALETARTIGGTSFDGTANIAVALAAEATALETARTIGGTSFDGTANIAVALATLATTVTITDNEDTNEDNALIFTAGGDVDGGNLGLESDGTLTYNPSTGKVTTTAVDTQTLVADGISTLTGAVTTGSTLGVGMAAARDMSVASGGTATTLQVTNSTAGTGAGDGLMLQSNGLTAALGNQESGDFSFFTNNNAGFILRTATLNVDFIAGITVADELIVTGTGPSAIGGAADGRLAVLIGGAYTSDGSGNLAAGTAMQHALTGAAGDTGSLAIAHIRGNINTQSATESIGVVTSLKVDEPIIVDNLGGSGVVTVAASVYVTAAPTEGAKNAAIFVAAGDVMLPASGKLYLDGGGDTYLAEDGANEVKLFAGGTLRMYLTGNTVRFPGAYANTTGSAVNMHVTSDGDLARSTSSLRYKTDVVDYELDRAQSLIAGLEPISYRHKEEDHHHLGFTAEAVHPHEPLLVTLNDDGEPDALEYERLVVPLTAVVQGQMAEIAALTDRIATLEAQA